jgi:hypothetical protein
MDKHLIQRKLDSLGRCLARLEARCPATPDELASDLDAQDIVSINLSGRRNDPASAKGYGGQAAPPFPGVARKERALAPVLRSLHEDP